MIQQQIFVSPDGQPHPRWVEAFPAAQVVTSADVTIRNEAGLVWVSTTLPAWQDAVRSLHGRGARVVVLSTMPDVIEAAHALDLGARGYAHAWSTPELLRRIAAVVVGDGHWIGTDLMRRLVAASVRLPATEAVEDRAMLLAPLTSREREVALAVTQGKSNKEIARDLGIVERTVKAHLAAVFEKLEVRDRLHLALRLAATQDDKLPL